MFNDAEKAAAILEQSLHESVIFRSANLDIDFASDS
jgi:hypothetical protein